MVRLSAALWLSDSGVWAGWLWRTGYAQSTSLRELYGVVLIVHFGEYIYMQCDGSACRE